jgi:hypothetical protein
VGWDVFFGTFGVDQQQPDFSIGKLVEINNPDTTTLAAACT